MAVKPEYKLYGLYFGLVLGIMFGASQQVRGAHFLSHDVFSLAVCWFSSLMLIYFIFQEAA
jgi:membrane-associated PAP2 superfamily phosphatase